MKDPFVFGYGSLVNTRTHAYQEPTPARLRGWRRFWRHTTLAEVAILTAYPNEGSQISGLIAHVPGNDWDALDLRENNYTRSALSRTDLDHGIGRDLEVQMYQTRTDFDASPGILHPVLLSYLDVVVQGYYDHFGPQGVTDFFATTDGWHAPVLNDRQVPRYARSQHIGAELTALVDHHVRALSAQVQQL